MSAKRGWIGVDLDGTLAYYGGWKGEAHIGQPISGMVDIVRDTLAKGEIDVRVFTARVSGDDPEEVSLVTKAIKAWCKEHIGQELEVTCKKDYQMVACYDDRSVQVIPNSGQCLMQLYDSVVEQLAAYEEE